MPSSRRNILQNSQANDSTHAGLWLEKYLDSEQSNESKRELVEQVSKPVSPNYDAFFRRWSTALESMGAQTRPAEVLGRLAINLGAEGVLETSIALHHTYGVPYIPGSAIKGLAANYARNHLDEILWGKSAKAYVTLFGDPGTAGYVNFLDALYIPGSGKNSKPLWPDVITVHHPKYYQEGTQPPADWDNPIPIPFLSATGKYLLALSGPETWVEAAFDILKLALAETGVGAKTSSGYGRMNLLEKEEMSGESYILKKKRLLKETPPIGRYRGTIVDTNQFSGRHGFINPAQGGQRIFAHINQLKNGSSSLANEQVVEYKIGSVEGRTQAMDIVILAKPGRTNG
ncbi:MAG: type III-B CRISPR module RAMP protein Cmr6 [Chloroflexi bacterium HGW-Chloroflexi-6]|nr:MAG: type III-B CRISPR module RAMP protein Cmr6 [Chloroflexi bacterium HGW-Chloroflexi-6]